MYDPEASREWKNVVAMYAKQVSPAVLFDGPLHLQLVFKMPRPRSVKGQRYPAVKPDLSNLEKAVEDALEGIVYTNDSRIVSKTSRKIYSEDGFSGVYIKVKGTIK